MLHKIIHRTATPYLLLIALSVGSLFWGLGALPFVGADECRYARIAEEMNLAGRWVTPLLEGHPWLEKPPLYYWITIPWIRGLGMSEISARLGPAFLALLSSMAILWLGTRLWSTTAGLFGGLITLTSVGFCAFGRSASPDMPVTACFTVCMAFMASAVMRGRMTVLSLVCAYGALGLAILAKGPVALVLACGIFVLFWALDETGGSLRAIRIFPGLLFMILVAFPWYYLAFRENGFAFISVFFINHNLARFVSELHHHEQPFYYFLPVLLGLFFPWTGWLPALASAPGRTPWLDPRKWDRRIVFLVCWALVPFLFFSFSRSKLPGYILPSFPPLALLLGMRLADWKADPASHRPLIRRFRWVHLTLSLCFAAAFFVVMLTNYGNAWLAGLMLAASIAIPAPLIFVSAGRNRVATAVAGTAAQGALLIVAMIIFAVPSLAAYHSARGIAQRAIAVAGSGEEIVTYCYFHHTLNYYTGYRVGRNLLDPTSLLAIAKERAGLLVVTERDRLAGLETMAGVAVSRIAEEGKLFLLRIQALPEFKQ